MTVYFARVGTDTSDLDEWTPLGSGDSWELDTDTTVPLDPELYALPTARIAKLTYRGASVQYVATERWFTQNAHGRFVFVPPDALAELTRELRERNAELSTEPVEPDLDVWQRANPSLGQPVTLPASVWQRANPSLGLGDSWELPASVWERALDQHVPSSGLRQPVECLTRDGRELGYMTDEQLDARPGFGAYDERGPVRYVSGNVCALCREKTTEQLVEVLETASTPGGHMLCPDCALDRPTCLIPAMRPVDATYVLTDDDDGRACPHAWDHTCPCGCGYQHCALCGHIEAPEGWYARHDPAVVAPVYPWEDHDFEVSETPQNSPTP